MTAGRASKVSSDVRQLGRRALSLGAATAFDYAVQFLLPIVLVRCLDPHAFGQYRVLWLLVGTVMACVTLTVPASLYYFLPRADGATKRLYINQTIVVHFVAGLIAAWAVSDWDPWLADKVRVTAGSPLIVPAFVVLWVVASILDVLPTVEERIAWQAKATIGLAATRAIVLSLSALVWRDLTPVLYALLAFVTLRVGVLLWYVAAHHRLSGPLLRRHSLVEQSKLATPFWASAALYSLRAQADQWVAATLFSLSMFASFSVAGVLGPLVNLFRQSVNYAFLPAMSRHEAGGDIPGMLDLNSRANVIVAALIFPLFAVAFVFAENIVTIVYTAAYVDAAPVMRIYIVGLAALVIELGSVTLLLRQGTFMMWLNLATLVVSVAMNWYAAQVLGLPGAAVGTVIAMYIDRFATLRRIGRKSGVPFAQLQAWRELAVLLLCAVLAAAAASAIVRYYFASVGLFLQLVAGSGMLLIVYTTLAALLAGRRGWTMLMHGSLR